MERNEVIKALECCEHIQCQGEQCPYHPLNRCREQLRHDCYALIKELTQANEMLSESYDHLEKTKDELLAERSKLTINMNAYGLTVKNLAEENERLRGCVMSEEQVMDIANEAVKQCTSIIKDDTVRKMQQRVKEKAKSIYLLSDPPKIMLEIREDVLDQIADELIKEETK